MRIRIRIRKQRSNSCISSTTTGSDIIWLPKVTELAS